MSISPPPRKNKVGSITIDTIIELAGGSAGEHRESDGLSSRVAKHRARDFEQLLVTLAVSGTIATLRLDFVVRWQQMVRDRGKTGL
jgi:hypothetical protein